MLGPKPLNDAQLEEEIIQCFLCLQAIANSKDLRMDFDNPVYVNHGKANNTIRKLSTMTSLQILCSFQTWNAKNIPKKVHELLEQLVSSLLEIGKKCALKKYDQFTLNTRCFVGSTRSNITPVMQFHKIFVTTI